MHAYRQLISLNLNTDSYRILPGFKGVYLQNMCIVQVNADRRVSHTTSQQITLQESCNKLTALSKKAGGKEEEK